MKGFLVLSGVVSTIAFTSALAIASTPSALPTDVPSHADASSHLVSTITKRAAPTGARGIATKELTAVVKSYCGSCHSPTQRKGNLILAGFNVDSAASHVEVSEKMIRKLRAQMMPPPNSRRPKGDTLVALVEALEGIVDAAGPANPGMRTFGRLNRPEYEHVVRDLLNVQVNAGDYLPLDTKSANFDNISDVQAMSPTLLEAYLNAAAAVSRMALGDRHAPLAQSTYRSSPFDSQHPWDHLDGTPYGTRGGLVSLHTFPADAEYEFRINIGGGTGTKLEDVVLSIDGAQVALLPYERGLSQNGSTADAPRGFDYLRLEPIKVTAGQHKISVAFVRRSDGPYEDLIKPHNWSRASGGNASAGTTEPPFVADLMVTGPYRVTGVSETASRRAILTCRPTGKAAQRACAGQIMSRLANKAYRQSVSAKDVASLMQFYDRAIAQPEGGFEDGVRLAMQAMLASPKFVFRFEKTPASALPGTDVRVGDFELASRLSFFLWGTMPDDRLLSLARHQQLSVPATYNAEVRRMLADPRSEAMSKRFAAQWLRLQDLEKVHPDAFLFPDFDAKLAGAMQKETELFFQDIVRRDASIFELYTADWTYVNERLAAHYGIPDVVGNDFRRVNYPDDARRGLFGQGSVLVQTSLGNRTSPVLRGKWVMEVLLGTPPPPPPPNIPDLEQTAGASDGKPLTTRQRMEMHRANPTCNSCHSFMDPIGLALDNFDVTGRQRFRENGTALDTRGQLYDGTPVSTPDQLAKALLARPIPLVRTFTENLMAYALGRRVEPFDQTTIRIIVKDAATKNYKFSSFVLGVVNSKAFRTTRIEAVAADEAH